MKIVFTMREVREIISAHCSTKMNGIVDAWMPVKFIHRYADGSGETEVDDVTSIDRVEVEFER